MSLLVLLFSLSFHALALDFDKEVRPLLEKRCYSCHGAKAQMHGLRLDSREAVLKGGDSGAPALVPGKSSSSLLYRYIAGLDKDIKMPPGEPMPAAEIETLKRWIDEGAVFPGSGPAQVVDEKMRRGRTHWSFQPLRPVTVPGVRNTAWVRNPIDAFVLAKLEESGWIPAPSATREQLLRRVYLDLTGLPPTLREQDEASGLDATIDRLLGNIHYAERWARHWLDVVRYAESNGYERDGVKPQAWKYRDWVIRALHEDKPFDRFVTEQIAGDELDDVTADTMVAAGFQRLGPWDDEPADPQTDRFDQLDDMVSTTSQAFLGLTIGCARCHNHKFEPLTASDYYSMVAIYNGLERPRKGRTELDLPVGTSTQLQREAQRDLRIRPLEQAISKLEEPYRSKEKDWADQIPSQTRGEIAALRQQIEALRRECPDLPRGYLMHEPKPAPPATHLLLRGKPDALGPEVAPAVPAILVKQQPQFLTPASTSRRRLSFARWLTSRENPLTARVIVNRVWMWHFGEGLVRTPSDFGLMGQKPTHPELLDWLAVRFMEDGWSLKKLHRLILTSNTWRMSKQARAEYQEKDPENRLLSHMHYKRLDVESIRDSILAASGRLNRTVFGPSMYPPVPPQALEGSSDPDKIWKASAEEEASRRTVYVFLKRSMIVPMLEVLDLCDTARSSAQRMTTSVPTQALTLFNGEFVNQQARYFAGRILSEAGTEANDQIGLAWRLALARSPRPEERNAMHQFLKKEAGAAAPENAALHALTQMARVIFNLNEMAYVD